MSQRKTNNYCTVRLLKKTMIKIIISKFDR